MYVSCEYWFTVQFLFSVVDLHANAQNNTKSDDVKQHSYNADVSGNASSSDDERVNLRSKTAKGGQTEMAIEAPKVQAGISLAARRSKEIEPLTVYSRR